MVKGRKNGNTKAPSPCRQNWILCALTHYQDVTVRGSTNLRSFLLPFKELNMGNDHLSTNSEYNNRSSINLPLQHALNQVDLNTDLLDKVILTEVVLRPTEKPRSVGPHKSILKNKRQQEEIMPRKQEMQECK